MVSPLRHLLVATFMVIGALVLVIGMATFFEERAVQTASLHQ
jgi:hypothetical protein